MRNAISKTVFILPILWVSALLLTQVPWLRVQNPRHQLEITANWIKKYQAQYKHLPWSLADLRLYAQALEHHFSPYDMFGLRLQYIPLTETAYVLRSFGADANENVYGSADDEVLLSGIESKAEPIAFTEIDQSLPLFYQASFLEGVKSPATGLNARLEINPQVRTRHLLIQDPKQAKFTMIAFHDGVEEFMWLPSGFEIVFTARGSERYEDGIFYWNLREGTSQNLLSSLRQQFWPKLPAEKSFYLSLSHVSASPPLLYLLAQPDIRTSLAPRSFYQFKNFFAVSIDADLGKNPTIQRIPANMEDSSFDYPISHLSLIKADKSGQKIQKAWQRLMLSGDAEALIDQWQSFCSQHPHSPMLPYGLWWLASIYNDTFRLMKDQSPEEAQVIRNYGIEIADALSSLATAPSYLRAMSEHLKKSLLLSDAADYSVSSPSFEP